MVEKNNSHICVTRIGQEQLLVNELETGALAPHCSEIAPGTVEISGITAADLAALPPFFSQQLLPNAAAVQGESIQGWARLLFEQIIERFHGESALPWQLLIYSPESAERGEVFSRARLIREALLGILKQKRRSLLKSLTDEPVASSAIVQLLLLDSAKGYLSIANAEERASLKAAVRPTVAGYEAVADDKAPPSRAFKKLVEALRVFDLPVKKGAHCVDLGASPGGWTHVLVAQGCTVTAIDRSPLDAPLMRNKKVSFIKGDALSWLPEKPADLLVCDVITAPERTLEMLTTWLTKKLCSAFCVTIKFKGDPDLEVLTKLRALLSEKTTWWDGKQLCHNKNEVTVVGVKN
jgi:23S rRNA (cytidine2498-2'-O)-methyltransferase